jgi:hypothetical protein
MALGRARGRVKRRLGPKRAGGLYRGMLDRLYLPLLALASVAVIALALVWPQGLGDQSPAPFGRFPVQRTPAVQAAMKREAQANERRLNRAREAVRELQAQQYSPGR